MPVFLFFKLFMQFLLGNELGIFNNAVAHKGVVYLVVTDCVIGEDEI